MNTAVKIKRYQTRLKRKLQCLIAGCSSRPETGKPSLKLPLAIFYRISDTGYPKIKPSYINNENCLRNAVKHFPVEKNRWLVIADNCCEETLRMIRKYIPEENIDCRNVGHGAGTFRLAYQMAILLDDNTPVYFLENDYLHRDRACRVLLEGLETAPYVSLYDHPDKYDSTHFKVRQGGERTRVLVTASSHWKYTHSTTMTFAALVKTLKKDKSIFDRWTLTKHPYDCEIFMDLAGKGRKLITPVPGYSTHGETAYLSPLINWEEQAAGEINF